MYPQDCYTSLDHQVYTVAEIVSLLYKPIVPVVLNLIYRHLKKRFIVRFNKLINIPLIPSINE